MLVSRIAKFMVALCFYFNPLFAEGADVIRIAFLTAEERQVTAFVSTIEQFEKQNKQYKVEIKTFIDSAYKANIDGWLDSGEFDLVHWQAGKRLFRYVDCERVISLNNYVDIDRINTNFNKNILNQLSKNDRLYALPLATYIWGFYYNKALFESLKLSPPNTWKEFFHVTEQIHKHGVPPLIQANADGWETLGWLDYLSLNTGGKELRHKFTKGELVSEEIVTTVISPLNELVQKDYFFAPEHTWNWVQAIASVGRGLAGMTLTGQFAEEVLVDVLDTRIGFFPFPESQQYGTVAPLDLLMIPTTSKNKLGGATFINFLSDKVISATLSEGLGWLPTTTTPVIGANTTERIKDAMIHLESSNLHVQYFDRDTATERAQWLDKYIVLLLANKNAKPLINYLQGK